MHLVYPPKILHNHFFRCSHPKRKRRPLLIRCIVVYVKMLNLNAMVTEEVCTVFDGSMRIYWYPTLWRNRFQELFSANHTSAAKRLFQKSLLRGALLKRFFFRWPFLPDTCGRLAKPEIHTKRDTCGWGLNMTVMKQFSYQTNWSFVVRKRRGSPAGRNWLIWLSNLTIIKFKNVMLSSSLSHYQRPSPARFLSPVTSLLVELRDVKRRLCFIWYPDTDLKYLAGLSQVGGESNS